MIHSVRKKTMTSLQVNSTCCNPPAGSPRASQETLKWSTFTKSNSSNFPWRYYFQHSQGSKLSTLPSWTPFPFVSACNLGPSAKKSVIHSCMHSFSYSYRVPTVLSGLLMLLSQVPHLLTVFYAYNHHPFSRHHY